MHGESQTNDTADEDRVKEVMGPTPEESKPVSVPNESKVDLPKTGEVIEPASEEKKSETSSLNSDLPSNKEVEEAFEAPIGWREKLKHAWRKYWRIPHIKLYTFGGLTLAFLLIALIPVSRYSVLNLVGIRCSASITLYDQTTRQPLKNVQVSLRGVTAVSGADGKVRLDNLKLGRATLDIKRRAFAEVKKTLTLGWGSNPQGNLQLKPTGDQYSFIVTDFLSKKPVTDAEADGGEFSASADQKGKIVLTVDAGQGDSLDVDIIAKGYRKETVRLDSSSSSAPMEIQLVSARKQPFITKQSGKYDLYKIDVDGKNEAVVLKGTGNEQPDIGLVAHPTDEVMAMVSTRDNVRNQDGFLLSTLTFVDLDDNSFRTLTHSERIQIIGWVGSKLVYVQVTQGASAANASRQKLMAYDYKTQKTNQLAASNSFNDLVLIGEDILYAPSNAYTPQASSGLYKISASGTNKQTVFDKEVWNIFRTDYDTLYLSVEQEWYQYKLNSTAKPSKQNGAPGDLVNREYVDSPDGKHSLWVDQRDGKGTLLLYDTANHSEKSIKQQPGLAPPVRWLDDHTVVYRIHSLQETADYVMNIDGGDAKKIREVTHTEGAGRWYYY